MASVSLKITDTEGTKFTNNGEYKLNNNVDGIIKMISYLNSSHYYYSSYSSTGTTFTTYYSDGTTKIYTGTLDNPNATSGYATATNVLITIPNLVTLNNEGSQRIQYVSSPTGPYLYTESGNLTKSTMAFLDSTTVPGMGKMTQSVIGNVNFDSSGNVSGSISEMDFNAEINVKKSTIIGNFNITGNINNIGAGTEVSTINGVLTEYDKDWFDGSYFHLTSNDNNLYISNDDSLIPLTLLSNPSNFQGNDTFNLDLPLVFIDSTPLESGTGDDSITVKGGDKLLINSGSGNDTIILHEGSHSVDGGDGFDIVKLDGKFNDYTSSLNTFSNQYTLVTKTGVNISTKNIESFSFSDQTVSVSNLLVPNITGNAKNDNLSGTSSNDILNGLKGNDILDGGIGIDTLIGGLGNDTYVVDSTTDTITELPKQGTDTVKSTVNFSIENIANVENLTLIGNDPINGLGSSFKNIITGNSQNNQLNGGAGNDTLIGGLGNDTYYIDSSGDVIIEKVNEGNDTIIESYLKIYSLSKLTKIENLTYAGTDSAKLTGNSLDNLLIGSLANDTLLGGLGNDTLIGGSGLDHFVLNTKVNNTSNVDTLSDFESGTDKIDLSKVIFKTLGAKGVLSTDAFNSGDFTSGQDSTDRIIYNTTSGAL